MTKQTDAEYFLTQLGSENPGDKKSLERMCLTGCWLTRAQWHDSVGGRVRDNPRLRYNLKPLNIPDLCQCDGCDAKMTVEHAFQCKVGGLVHCRHINVTTEFCSLCTHAVTPGAVDYKPIIYSGNPRPLKRMLPQQMPKMSRNNTMQLMGRPK